MKQKRNKKKIADASGVMNKKHLIKSVIKKINCPFISCNNNSKIMKIDFSFGNLFPKINQFGQAHTSICLVHRSILLFYQRVLTDD